MVAVVDFELKLKTSGTRVSGTSDIHEVTLQNTRLNTLTKDKGVPTMMKSKHQIKFFSAGKYGCETEIDIYAGKSKNIVSLISFYLGDIIVIFPSGFCQWLTT